MISLDESDSETNKDDLEQIDSASCQLVSYGTGINTVHVHAVLQYMYRVLQHYTQVLQHKRRVTGLLQTPRKLNWLLRTEQNGNAPNFLQNREIGYKLRTC